MRVSIVGGSIAGCAAAYHLDRAGHEVTVFERSGRLVDHGIAVGTAAAAFEDMTMAGLLPVNFPLCRSHTLHYVTRAQSGIEQALGSEPLAWATMRWQDLHEALRAQVPAGAYRSGRAVTAIRSNSDAAPAVEVGGGTRTTDLVVLADGNQSLARSMHPFNSHRSYTGLALLRGLVPEAGRSDRGMYDQLTRTMFAGGHAVSYTVPGFDGATSPGRRDVMWGVYLGVPERMLSKLTTAATACNAADGGARTLALTPQHQAALLAPVLPLLPDQWAARIARTQLVHLQPIYDAITDTLHHHRVCLVGDAGSVYPPFNANGVMKAARMAASLARALPPANTRGTSDVVSGATLEAALAAWNGDELATAKQEYDEATHLRRQLINDVPADLASDHPATQRWLRALHPDVAVATSTPGPSGGPS